MDPLLAGILQSQDPTSLVQETRPDWARPEPTPEPELPPRPSLMQNLQTSARDTLKGLNRGFTTDLAGAPVDILNLMLKTLDDTRLLPQRFSTAKPVGGSEWLNEKAVGLGLAPRESGSPNEAAARMVSGFINPTTAPALMAVMLGRKAAETAGGAQLMKYLAGKHALERGDNPQDVWRKYGIAKTAEGDYLFEPPVKASETEALDQFRKFYPKEKVKVMLGKGTREGYYHQPSGEIYAQGADTGLITDFQSRRRVLEHELQHAADAAEGRSGGAGLEDPNYWNYAGEVRARNAEERLDLLLRHWNPAMTEDTSRLKQIIKSTQEASPLSEAVKEPGGMWHPEAVERLAEPLKSKLFQGDFVDYAQRLEQDPAYGGKGITQQQPGEIWADRAIRNYLNKYAGTERDPLKDVEIPQYRWVGGREGEVTTWGQTLDDLVGAKPAILSKKDLPKGTPKYEAVWDLSGSRIGRGVNEPSPFVHGTDLEFNARHKNQADQALKSYLFHVGDYLRQNVPAEKLQQYDLVRAVKETAANDARIAREMEKAAAASMKDLPVYKDYSTNNPGTLPGMKWVELKLPEKLTQEQMKGVRPATRKELKLSAEAQDPHGMPYEGELEGFVAVDHKGNPIRNSYTESLAVGATPEEAYLAGQLAQEGNQMGHCVGGYCEPVASGESRIFSLRDAKGKSHVTVEVGQQARRVFNRKPTSDELTTDILQIKGKQNRAPVAEYLPYVQDFVKSGKWGEVGDLHNAGLMKHPTKPGEYINTPHPDSPEMQRMREYALRQRLGDIYRAD